MYKKASKDCFEHVVHSEMYKEDYHMKTNNNNAAANLESAGIKIVKIVNYSESSSSPSPVMYNYMKEMSIQSAGAIFSKRYKQDRTR